MAENHLFEGLSTGVLSWLLSHANLTHLPRGTVLFNRSENFSSVTLVVSGLLKLFRETHNGAEVVLSLPRRGEIIGVSSILSNGPHYLSAQSIEDSWALTFPCAVLTELSRTEPVFLQNVMRHMAMQLRLMQMENEHLMMMSAPQRVGCMLLQLWRKSAGRTSDVDIHSKNLTAARLGMKPETFSRALAQLSEAGVRTVSGRVQLQDPQKLTDYSCETCSATPNECEWRQKMQPSS